MSLTLWFLLVLAGIGGGLSGSIAGLASLVSYPALLAAGLPATTANVTNTVALVASGAGTVLGSRPELRGQAPLVRQLLVWAIPGGILGSVLLLLTPSETLEKLVPFLIGGAALAVLVRTTPAASAQPLGDIPADEIPHTAADVSPYPPKVQISRPFRIGTFVVGIYAGYFGAAAGVMLLALILGFTGLSLARSSAVRTVVLTSANVVAAIYFALFGPVDWMHCLPLAIGFLAGGRIGPLILRHAPAGPLRILIALTGLGLSVKLGLDAFA
ncbi:sulfite exporter TauE/SafE family protein [Kineosporia babensis]|uniref:Probable membrane transporter protein n=1 Tax=Kineosporia babensis TaxID=499548 RepID=A0A9X1SUJ9_9ACTN|nr:sulfite exporter TauE/SafE family protein [Kineosporia babensis]MCD5312521.1 sulfite exporter TauE/SafE family protein [Kineosporia babensis]